MIVFGGENRLVNIDNTSQVKKLTFNKTFVFLYKTRTKIFTKHTF